MIYKSAFESKKGVKQGFTHRLRNGLKQPVVIAKTTLLRYTTGCLLGRVAFLIAPLIQVLYYVVN